MFIYIRDELRLSRQRRPNGRERALLQSLSVYFNLDGTIHSQKVLVDEDKGFFKLLTLLARFFCAKIEFQQDLAVEHFDYVFEVRTAPKHRLQWRPKMNKRWAKLKEKKHERFNPNPEPTATEPQPDPSRFADSH